ncbi:MAG: hypothetical protein IT204_01315 [Fimbriimonadaceae bacterium]|nr:hypothetical protein [Fimbriimonadaceae bacterium]
MGCLRRCWQRSPDGCCLLLLAALQLLFWAPLVTGRLVPVFDDTGHYYYPIRHLLGEALRAGRLPLWTPLLNGGYPLLAEGQVGGLYPPQVLFALLPAPLALRWTVLLHGWLAAALLYGYLRCVGCRPAPAAVGGLAFSLSGAFVGHLVYLPMACSLVWLPGACWGIEAAYRRRDARCFGGTAVALALALLAVHAQMAAYVALTSLAYGLLRAGGTPGRRLWGTAGVLGAGLLAGLLAAGQLLPLAELLGQTQRGAGLDRGLLLQYGLTPQWLLFLFLPRFFGHPTQPPLHWADLTVTWELNAYCGLATVMLALLAPLLARRRLAWALALLWWGSFLLAWGRATPLFELLHSLPVMQSFRIPARWLLPGTFAGCALAGLGLEALCRGVEPARLKRSVPLVLTVGVMLLALAILVLDGGRLLGKVQAAEAQRAYHALAWFALLWYSGLFVLLGGQRRRWLPAAVGLLLAVDLFVAQRDFNPLLPAADLDPAQARRVDPVAARVASDLGDERVYIPPYSPYPLLKPSSQAIMGIAAVDNFAPLRLARVDTLLNLWKDDLEPAAPVGTRDKWLQEVRRSWVELSPGLATARLAWLQRWRVRWSLPRYGPPGTAGDRDGLWEVPGPRPAAAYLPRQVVVLPAAAARAAIARAAWPAGEVVTTPVAVPAAAAPGPVALTALTPSRLVTAAAGPGLLVVSQTAYPGWQAWQDGQRLAVTVADTLHLAAALPRRGAVRWVFAPSSLRIGWFVSGLALAALLAWVVARR